MFKYEFPSSCEWLRERLVSATVFSDLQMTLVSTVRKTIYSSVFFHNTPVVFTFQN